MCRDLFVGFLVKLDISKISLLSLSKIIVWKFFYFDIFCFYSLSSYGHFEDIRLAAIECLVDLSKCELPYPTIFVPLRLIFHLNQFFKEKIPWKIVSLKVSFQLTTISNDSKHFKRRLTAPLFSLKLVALGLFVFGNDFTNIPSPQKMVLNVARIFFYSWFFSREPWKRNDLLDWSYWERPGSIYQVCINFDCWSEAKSSNLIIPFTGHTLYVKKSPLHFSIVV